MGELAVIEPSQASNVQIWKQSTDAASLCKEIVVKRAINLQGKRYVPVEGWQAIAIAHGCVAGAENVQVTDQGVTAEGVIRRMSDGAEIARAEGFVGNDERTWANRPMFARRGMAQTRAISRACRSAFAHVVVMMDVGLETTPYEEMQAVQDEAPRNTPPTPQARRARDLKREEPKQIEAPEHDPQTGEVTDEQSAAPTKGKQTPEEWTEQYKRDIAECETLDDLIDLQGRAAKAMAKLQTEHADLYEQAIDAGTRRASELQQEEPAE